LAVDGKSVYPDGRWRVVKTDLGECYEDSFESYGQEAIRELIEHPKVFFTESQWREAVMPYRCAAARAERVSEQASLFDNS
jgi:hypothetical protein